jgi:sn-glycerol 3-phosphate transport system ATP-binding protein
MNITNFRSYVGRWILNVEDILLEPGQVTLIHGPSGCGKTSFFQGLIGLNQAEYSLKYYNLDLSKLSPSERKLSVVFQANNLFEHLTVIKNLELVKSKDQTHDDFMKRISNYKIDDLLAKKASVLSGGEKQMVSCVRAFLHQGRRLLLLDEPWSSMDFDNKTDYRNHLLDFLKEQNLPCILISHDKDEEISFLNPGFIYDFTQIARFEKGQPEDL